MANENREPYVLDFPNGQRVEDILKKADADYSKAEIDAKMASKATMSDVQRETQNLQNQINEIVRAPESGGDVAAEVAQARVGTDGTTYQTLKARLDSEYDTTSMSVDVLKNVDLNNLVISNGFDLLAATTINGAVASNGHWYSSANNRYQSKVIENNDYSRVIFIAGDSNASVSFGNYAELPVPVDGASVVFADGETGRHVIMSNTTMELEVPTSCTHIIIQSRWSTAVDVLPAYAGAVHPIPRVEHIEQELDNVVPNHPTIPSFIDGYYREIRPGEGGKLIANSRYSCTDLINVIGVVSVTVCTFMKGGDTMMGVGFYDANGAFISGTHLTSTPDYTYPVTAEVAVPSNAAFMAYSIVNSSDVDKLKSYYLINQNNAGLSDYTRQLGVALYVEQPNYLSSAENILCIGDSLTEGAYYLQGGGSVATTKTYPEMLRKYTGCSVTNAGMGGKTVKQWMVQKRPSLDFSEYDTFIVWLGTNAGLTDTLDADVLPYESYEDYADTQTGQYCRLVEEINHDTGGDCLIVICNLFASSGSVPITNSVLEQIYNLYVEKGYKMILIDMSDLTQQNLPELHHYIANNHFGIAGNCFVANRIMEKINAAIKANTRLSEYNITGIS